MKVWKYDPNIHDGNFVKCLDDNLAINTYLTSTWGLGQSPGWHPPPRSRPVWNTQPNLTTIADPTYDESVERPP